MDTPIIAIHGAGMTSAVWEPLKLPLRALEPPAALLSIEDMAAWVGKQLDSPCILMGHSMGALVALAAAAHPAVQRLILLGAGATMPVHPDLLKQAHENPAVAADLILKWGVSPAHADVKPLLKNIMNEGAATLGSGLAACDAYKNGVEAAKNCQKPALVIAGEHDKMSRPENGEALAKLFPHGRFTCLPATGHMMMVENPAGTAAEIKAFF